MNEAAGVVTGSGTRTHQDTVVICGGRGFIGSALVQALTARGYSVLVLSRSGSGETHHGASVLAYSELAQLRACRAVINLAGADIAGGRWTAARKQELRGSRLETTALLCEWVRQLQSPPQVFVSASAIGYYGETGETPVDESAAAGHDFASRLCRDWEAALDLPADIRRVILRIGVVLGPRGGALRRMLPAFRLGLGGPIGHGRQWMSWIALADLLNLILSALDDAKYAGVYNAVAPEPVRNRDFARALGGVLHRPALLPVPAFVLRLLLGEMSSLLLGSQRILPQHALEQGFQFRYAEIEQALATALGQVDESGG